MPGLKYPFLLASTDRSDKGGTYWWSIFNISPLSGLFLFNSFGIEGLKHFIIQGDRKIINKLLKVSIINKSLAAIGIVLSH